MMVLRLLTLAVVAWLCACGSGTASAQTPLMPPIPPCMTEGPCLPGYKVVSPEIYDRTDKGRHLFTLVEQTATGARAWYAQSCSHMGNDCNEVKWVEYTIKRIWAAATEKRAVQESYWRQFFTYTCDAATKAKRDWQGEICREQNNLLLQHDPLVKLVFIPEPGDRYVVAYNASCSDANKAAGTCTRPVSAYNPITKTRSVAKGETVAVGAPCYPAVITHKDSPNSSVTYMAIDPLRPDRVAVCSKG